MIFTINLKSCTLMYTERKLKHSVFHIPGNHENKSPKIVLAITSTVKCRPVSDTEFTVPKTREQSNALNYKCKQQHTATQQLQQYSNIDLFLLLMVHYGTRCKGKYCHVWRNH